MLHSIHTFAPASEAIVCQRFYGFSIMKKTVDIETTMTITITIGTATGSGQYGTYSAEVDRKKTPIETVTLASVRKPSGDT
jgi:hypothetical protein